MAGKFYGIGVGPGDPELLTIKATKILKTIDIVICPESKKGQGSIALNIAKDYLPVNVEILYLNFPMTYDEEILNKAWSDNANTIYTLLNNDKNIGFLTLGDPMIYSTYMYLIPHLKLKHISIETIPGITSFSALASRVNIPLTSGEETLGIIPLRKNIEGLEKALENFDNLIIMKPSNEHEQLGETLKNKNLENNFVLVSKCGTVEEKISYDIRDLTDKKVPYLSTLVIKNRGLKYE
ncbi:precorrin-2 C(20)-methyltransferase [Clostridium sp. D2Q-11]|uniref:Precorrin-2 C(20)-methyltransferase n=1 Tax=Anaeromonas frigoriresistens TaxID=2683708 RepID=A0A942UU10_9FIRM|nr:precorrin-2 C(20)-methyltransferase [Anaeromonas frigoriresistens]MBS4538573.1 precorrin-2 C(20)-methyltransferase [Anaeromonas frigoriresistens]